MSVFNADEAAGMQEIPELRYTMGFSVDGTPIPDPNSFSVTESDLDTMGERDATGYLHRNMVATKINMKIGWTSIPWNTIMDIGKLTRGPKFRFSFPNPFSGQVDTIDAYAGDRATTDKWSPPNGTWIGDISFSVIQY